MGLNANEQWVYALGWQVPELCTLRKVLGIRCPGCGLTRSFVFMGHGEWWTALRMNWLGPPFWLAGRRLAVRRLAARRLAVYARVIRGHL